MRYNNTLTTITKTKKPESPKCWWEYKATGTLIFPQTEKGTNVHHQVHSVPTLPSDISPSVISSEEDSWLLRLGILATVTGITMWCSMCFDCMWTWILYSFEAFLSRFHQTLHLPGDSQQSSAKRTAEVPLGGTSNLSIVCWFKATSQWVQLAL